MTERVFHARKNLRWQEFDSEYLVFNPLSDEIHRLNMTAATALAELEAGPRDAAQLTARLASLLKTPADDALHQQVRLVLDQFDQSGLVIPMRAASSPANGSAGPTDDAPPPPPYTPPVEQ